MGKLEMRAHFSRTDKTCRLACSAFRAFAFPHQTARTTPGLQLGITSWCCSPGHLLGTLKTAVGHRQENRKESGNHECSCCYWVTCSAIQPDVSSGTAQMLRVSQKPVLLLETSLPDLPIGARIYTEQACHLPLGDSTFPVVYSCISYYWQST